MTTEFAHLDPFLMPQSDEQQDMSLIYSENELSLGVDQRDPSVDCYQERITRKSKTVPHKIPVLAN